MLDTVVLTIPQGFYGIRNPRMFLPNANVLAGPGNYLVRCVNNPTATDKKAGTYKPRMTLMKRPYKYIGNISLRVEFSVQKILYGNNVDEVNEKDFDRVTESLRRKMLDMGVAVSADAIRTAKVSAMHPAKNIELKGGYSSSFVIKELNKVNLTERMDINKDSFRNEGQSLQYYTNSHSFVVYDKIKDIKKPRNRATDKDQNYLQASLFDELVPTDKPKEILRIEVRLTKKVKLNAIMRQVKCRENPDFQHVFNAKLCHDILQLYWQELIADKNLFLFNLASGPKKTLQDIIRSNPDIKPKQAIYLAGLNILCKDARGIRELRKTLEGICDRRTWYRVTDDFKILNNSSPKNYHGWVAQVEDALEKFEPYELIKHPKRSIAESAYSAQH